MPVSTFQVKPTTDSCYRSDDKAIAGNDAEAFEEVKAILLQLGEVARHATAMFQDLFNETVTTTERVARLSHVVEKNIFATDQESNALQFIENRVVHFDEPMRLYEAAGKQPRPLQPPGAAPRCGGSGRSRRMPDPQHDPDSKHLLQRRKVVAEIADKATRWVPHRGSERTDEQKTGPSPGGQVECCAP